MHASEAQSEAAACLFSRFRRVKRGLGPRIGSLGTRSARLRAIDPKGVKTGPGNSVENALHVLMPNIVSHRLGNWLLCLEGFGEFDRYIHEYRVSGCCD